MDKAVTVYKLLDPVTNKVRYVGCTTNAKQRKWRHGYATDWELSPRQNWINRLARLKLKPVFVVIQETTKDAAEDIETFWINHYIDTGYRLLNRAQVRR